MSVKIEQPFGRCSKSDTFTVTPEGYFTAQILPLTDQRRFVASFALDTQNYLKITQRIPVESFIDQNELFVTIQTV